MTALRALRNVKLDIGYIPADAREAHRVTTNDGGEFSIGNVTAQPGTRAMGMLELAPRLDNTQIGIPIVIVNGEGDGPVVLMDGGTHGDETEGILAVQRMAQEIEPNTLSGVIIAVPVVNLLAAEAMDRAIPKGLLGDAKPTDLNRVFPGDARGTTSQRLAHLYATEVIPSANYMVSCHGGGASFMVSPKILYVDNGDEVGNESRKLAEWFGWEVLCSDIGGYEGTSAGVAWARGIPTIVPEHGGAYRMPSMHRRSIQVIVDGLRNVLYKLNMLEGEAVGTSNFRRSDANEHIHAGRDGFVRYSDDIDTGVTVEEGQQVGVLLDVYGQEQEVLVSDWAGIITLLRAYPLVHVGDWIASVTIEQ